MATGLGVFFQALDPVAAGVACGTWVLVYTLFRISSLGSLVATASIPVTLGVRGAPRPFLVLAGVVLTLVLVRHRGNIRRIVSRQEGRV